MTTNSPPRLVVGITGASGAILGIRLLEVLRTLAIETHLVISPAAQTTITQETDFTVRQVSELADFHYNHQDIAAPIASGSFPTNGMVVIPCSIKTLSAITNSYADNLLTRAADVTLKEGRPLALVVRETPLHKGHLRLMTLAAEAGAIIYPPVPAFYIRQKNLDAMITSLVGRLLARIGINNRNFNQWTGLNDNEP